MKKMPKNIQRIWYFIAAILFWIVITLWFLWVYKWTPDFSDKENMITINNTWEIKTAYFAGWCFWCMEWIFEAQDGVSAAISWYIGWPAENANYSDVSSGNTQHREWVRVLYNSEIITYDTLVELFWTQIDPVDAGGQFGDRGFQYTTAIYYSDEQEKEIAENSKNILENSWKFEEKIVTEILKATAFYDAEEYHQDYYKKSSLRYNLYKKWSGRAGFIDENWKDRIAELNANTYSEEALRKNLTSLQYKVTQEWWTEKPFDNEYWDNKQAGIYVDIIDGSALYSSLDKYVSGTGWPTFSKPISSEVLTEHEDNGLFYTRTEIKSASSSAHVWHVFTDGPVDKWGLRYCMNSAALRFIPVDKLEEEGYEKYLKLFK